MAKDYLMLSDLIDRADFLPNANQVCRRLRSPLQTGGAVEEGVTARFVQSRTLRRTLFVNGRPRHPPEEIIW